MRISDWSSDVCSSDLTVVAGFTADGYNSIEFHHAGGDTFKIGDFGAVVQTENPVNFNVPVTIVDGDGDTAPGSLAITTAPPLLVIGSATDADAGEPTDHVVANQPGQPDGHNAGGGCGGQPHQKGKAS